MKIKFYALMMFVFHFGITKAQITTQLVQPGNYAVTLEKVSSFSIFTQKAYHVVAKITISDDKGKLAELHSQPFDLTSGTARYDLWSRLKNIVYFERSFEEYYKSVGNFPHGNYEICLQILCPDPPVCKNSINDEFNTQVCHDVEVIEPTPLILVNPYDEEKLLHVLPYFQWIPPMPLSNRIPLQYRMKLVKLEDKQMGEDGMYRNRPIFQSDMLVVPYNQYLSSYTTLEKGQKYAWMVDAYSNGRFITNSEVWEFEIIEPVIKNEAYLLKTNMDNGSLTWEGPTIKLGFETNYPVDPQSINKVTAYQNNQILASNNLDIGKIHLGKNVIELDLFQLGFVDSGTYLIEIVVGLEKYWINISFKSEN